MTAPSQRGPGGVIAPGGAVGILGGGQLGRMLALAAARLGLRCHVFCPDEDRPASLVAERTTVAAYDDEDALARFAEAVDVVTYEFENVPAGAAQWLDGRVPVRPAPDVLAIAQDRLAEKQFLADAGIAVAPFAAVSNEGDLGQALAGVGLPAVLKTRRFGYDGKGQALVGRADDGSGAWQALGRVPALVEAFVPFACEASVIVCRAQSGETRCYDPARNRHERHILAESRVPAGLGAALGEEAVSIARRIAAALDYVGVMGVEMFVTPGAQSPVVVNEIAPRVHNSGHWTLDACAVSQFEQHIRAICGWPLGPVARHSDAVMTNLLGDDVGAWQVLAGEPGAALHIYGKRAVVAGRKMGHVTRLYPLGTLPSPAGDDG